MSFRTIQAGAIAAPGGALSPQAPENSPLSVTLPAPAARQAVESFLATHLPPVVDFEECEMPRMLDRPAMEALMLERPPFFFIERAVAIGRQTVYALAPMSIERCAGHFPTKPIVPLIELCKAMAQTGIILTSLHAAAGEVPIAIGSGESKALARELIRAPADVLIRVRLQSARLKLFFVDGEAFIDGRKIGTLAKIVYTLVPRDHVTPNEPENRT